MDEPQHHEVSRDAQEHVCELQGEIPDEGSGHVYAVLIHCLLSTSGVNRSVRDDQQRGVDV